MIRDQEKNKICSIEISFNDVCVPGNRFSFFPCTSPLIPPATVWMGTCGLNYSPATLNKTITNSIEQQQVQ